MDLYRNLDSNITRTPTNIYNSFNLMNIISMVVIAKLLIVLSVVIYNKLFKKNDISNKELLKDNKTTEDKDNKTTEEDDKTEEDKDDKSELNKKFDGVVFIFMEGCGYCTRLKKMLDDEKITTMKILSHDSPDAISLIKEYKFNGFPAWCSLKTKKFGMGAMELEMICEKLGHPIN